MPGTKNVHKQLGKGKNCREISGKFGVVASTAYKKVNTMGTDENLFRLVTGHGARVLSTSGTSACTRHSAQLSARALTKGNVHARTLSLNRA